MSKEQECRVCKGTYPLTDEFWHHNKNKQSGFNIICKRCKNAQQKERRLAPVWLSEDQLPDQSMSLDAFDLAAICERIVRSDTVPSIYKAVV